jgi:outer membrane receptor for ferrienterochelin and colicins
MKISRFAGWDTARVRKLTQQCVGVVVVCCQITQSFANNNPPAAAEPDADLTELSLEQLVQIEIPSVVGASKYEQKANVAPSSITVITADEIKKYGHQKLSDVLRSVRGFYTTNDHNYEFLGVRGFGLPSDYNSRVLMLIDGHRVNDPVYQQGMIGGELPIDVDLIDRVEIIRGPGSSLYGTSAFFAVVNIIPKRGKDIKGVEVSGGAASFDTRLGRLTAGKELANGADFVLSASTYNRNGQDTLRYSELAGDPTHNDGVHDRGDTEQWKSFYASLKYKDLTLEATSSKRRKGFGTGLYSTVFNSTDSSTTDARQSVDLQYQHAFGEDSSMFARLYYDRYDYFGDFAFVDSPLNVDNLDAEWWGGEYRYLTKLGSKHRLTIGGEYIDYFRQELSNFDRDPSLGCVGVGTVEPCLDSSTSTKTWGIFVQDEFAVTDKLTLNLGVRYDDLYRGTTSTNPRLGIIFSPSAETTYKLLYGTAFRAPNGFELYYTGSIYKANPDLTPEEIKTLEAAVEHSFSKNLRGIASVYQYRMSDLIVLNAETDTSGNEILIFRNLSNVKASGLDLELQAKWAQLEGRVSYSHQKAEDEDSGETLPNMPKHMLKLNAIAPLYQDKLYAGLEVQYLSGRNNVQNSDATRARSVPGYTIANATLTQRNWIKGLEISLSAYNLLDKKYREPVSVDEDDAIVEGNPQEGRSLRLKLTYKF